MGVVVGRRLSMSCVGVPDFDLTTSTAPDSGRRGPDAAAGGSADAANRDSRVRPAADAAEAYDAVRDGSAEFADVLADSSVSPRPDSGVGEPRATHLGTEFWAADLDNAFVPGGESYGSGSFRVTT